jgi:hypothetical protein
MIEVRECGLPLLLTVLEEAATLCTSCKVVFALRRDR